MKKLLSILSVLLLTTTVNGIVACGEPVKPIPSKPTERIDITNKIPSAILIKQLSENTTTDFLAKLQTSSNLNKDRGVTKIQSNWYNFGAYKQIYLSEYLVLDMKNIEQEKDSSTAIKYMLDILNSIDWTYVIMVSSNLPVFLANWYAWNPLKYDTGNGIFWGQTLCNIFTGVWSQ